jgi:cell division protein FtsB
MKKSGILKFVSITALFFAFIIAWLGFGERGFIHLYRMEKDRQAYAEKIEQLREKNRELLEEIERLRSDDKYIESLARREFDLIKDDEVLYRFSDGEGRVRTKNQSRNSGQP